MARLVLAVPRMSMHRALPALFFLAACGRPLGVPEVVVDGPTTSTAPAVGASEPGPTCGGPKGTPCDRASFCQVIECGGRETVGTCIRRPDDCTGANAKQAECGCDGITYANDCLRQQAGVSLAHTGVCATPREVCNFPTPSSCAANGCTWFICPPAADCQFDNECIPDCRTTGCGGNERCDSCEHGSDVVWICIANGVAC